MVCEKYPNCRSPFQAKAKREIRVRYNEVEEDVLFLCDECADFISKDAKSHGYKVKDRRLK